MVGTPAWFEWLESATTFAFTCTSGRFTARKEARSRGGMYWKAYHTANGTLHRAYLGETSELTLAHLTNKAEALATAAALMEPPALALHSPAAPATPSNLLTTKFNVPTARAQLVTRPRLFEQLEVGLQGKLTLIAAPAGFGKTTLLSAWIAGLQASDRQVAWLSLDEGDSDLVRFLTYLTAALRTIIPTIGSGVMGSLHSPHPPPAESVLTALLNEITTLPDDFVLVLDDYHVIDSPAVDQALTFLVEYMPPQMHLVITTREDPSLPLARLRARGDLSELRAPDLRFTNLEAAQFLSSTMGLRLSPDDVAALETRTEGWIAGLQLAALSMQGHKDSAGFVKTFTGSHHFVLDYLVEEVLQQQPESVQHFLLSTSFLDRLCGPLCDAVLRDPSPSLMQGTGLRSAPSSGQATLEYLERANLFIVPLDNERRWYRYHRLFADLLRQRLQQQMLRSAASSAAAAEERESVYELHRRASQWYEEHGFKFEAFQHAATANDVERAGRLVEGEGIPRHFQGATTTVLEWLESLPKKELDARPSLWWKYASLLLVRGKVTGVEEKLQAAEAAMHHQQGPLDGSEANVETRNLIGQIAVARAVLAVPRYQVQTMLTQSQRALEYLSPNNLEVRATANWTLGTAYQQQRDRAAARRAFTESISLSHASGDSFTTVLATKGLADIQIAENRLYVAAESLERVLQILGDRPLPVACEAHLGLARIYYEWNDLDTAEQHGQESLHLARQFGPLIDRSVLCEVFLARLKLAQGDVIGASAILLVAGQSARKCNFSHLLPEVAAMQVLMLLVQDNRMVPSGIAAAAELAQAHDLPISQARVYLAQGDASAALAVLEPLRNEAEARGWDDERLKVMVLEAITLRAHGEMDRAAQMLSDALALAEPGGFIRIFVDEGPIMEALLREVAKKANAPKYVAQLLAAFGEVGEVGEASTFGKANEERMPSAQLLIEPLSERELEVLRLLGTELNGPEIASELMVSLNTMRTHTNNIYNKLGVNNRRAAVRRGEELYLL